MKVILPTIVLCLSSLAQAIHPPTHVGSMIKKRSLDQHASFSDTKLTEKDLLKLLGEDAGYLVDDEEGYLHRLLQDPPEEHRQLDSHCKSRASVAAGNCTLTEYCEGIRIGICEGDFETGWKQTNAIPERCLYIGKGIFGLQPYDADLYNEAQDFCVQLRYELNFVRDTRVKTDKIISVSRGGTGNFTIEIDAQLQCNAAYLNGEKCTTCIKCPSGTAQQHFVNCGNVLPKFTLSCIDDSDLNYFAPAVSTGAYCTETGYAMGKCSLEEFCTVESNFFVDTDYFCTEDASTGEFNYTFVEKEKCRYEGTEDELEDYNQTRFNAETDICQIERVETLGKNRQFETEYYIFNITRPCEIDTVTESTYIDCKDDTSGNIYQPYCYSDSCDSNRISIEGEVCDWKCTCPDPATDLGGTCTNLDPSFVQPCGDEYYQIDYALVDYYCKNNGTRDKDIPDENSTAFTATRALILTATVFAASFIMLF